MEINVNVKIDLSEATLRVLSALFAGTVVTGTKETPVVKLEEKTTGKKKTEKPADTTGSVDEEAVRSAIRTKVVSLRDAGHKDKTVDLMTKYKVTKLSDLPVDQLTTFQDELNAIK